MAGTKKKLATKARKTTAARETSAKKTTKSREKPTTKVRVSKSRPTIIANKSAAKKTAEKKTIAKKKIPALKMSKTVKPMTKSQQLSYLAERTGMAKKEAQELMGALEEMISAHLNGPGNISLAGLLKILVKRMPATKARKGINPFTGEPAIFKAKPARNTVKARALKKLKEQV